MDIYDNNTCLQIGRTCTCFNLRRASRIVTQKFDEHLRKVGVKPNQFTILMIAHVNKDILLTRMADFLGMERTTLTRNLSALERAELLTVRVGEDKRERLIRITSKGTALLEEAFPLWEKAQAEVVQTIGQEKFEKLFDILNDIRRKI